MVRHCVGRFHCVSRHFVVLVVKTSCARRGGTNCHGSSFDNEDGMRQLVGLRCVLCEKSVGNILEGRFCESCGCPIHTKCVRSGTVASLGAGCNACGATPEDVGREKALHQQDERERRAESVGRPNSESEWPVLLALAHRFRSPLALRLQEDRGFLEWELGQIRLIGRRFHEFKGITSLSIVRQSIPWFAVFITNSLCAGMSLGGVLAVLTPSNPATWFIIGCLNIILIWSTVSTKWIRVTYKGSSGSEEVVYLLPVNSLGWRRIDGAADQLLEILTKGVLTRPESIDLETDGILRNRRRRSMR